MSAKKILASFLVLVIPGLLLAQVLAPPSITCISVNKNTGNNAISWGTPPPNNCGPFIGYVLYGSLLNSGMPFQVIDTITNPLDTTTIHAGANAVNQDWHYYMITLYDCPGAVSPPSDTIIELISPDIDYVTVDSHQVIITWPAGISSLTSGYVIYYDPPGVTITSIDTVYGINTTTYIDTFANPDIASYNYTIAAFSFCDTTDAASSIFTHNSIFLRSSVQPCNERVTLNWNLYKNWPGSTQYEVLSTIDGNPLPVFPLQDGSVSYEYSIAGITGDTICFIINAIRDTDGQISASNEICLEMDFIRSATFNNLRNVSVNPGGDVEIEWYIDTMADLDNFILQRGITSTLFNDILTIPADTLVYLNDTTDFTALTNENSYYYQIVSRDDCGDLKPSTIGRTILLTGNNTLVKNSLSWNEFELEYATVNNYIIHRGENNLFAPVTTVGPAKFSYEDDIGQGITETGAYCYRIEAKYQLNIPGIPTENLSSFSNTVCLEIDPVIYVPNAFNPNSEVSENKVFKPSLLNPNVAEYEFVIFDRWGKQLFYTNEVSHGWHGDNNGEIMPQGGYVYYVRLVTPSGVTKEKKGVFILLR